MLQVVSGEQRRNLELTLILYLISKSTISASFLIIYPFCWRTISYPVKRFGNRYFCLYCWSGTSNYTLYNLFGNIILYRLISVFNLLLQGSDDLVLPLVIMGFISVIGGIVSLRLPETLHHRLPQTVEEGEEFGKDFTTADCFQCIPLRRAEMGLTILFLLCRELESALAVRNLPKRTLSGMSLTGLTGKHGMGQGWPTFSTLFQRNVKSGVSTPTYEDLSLVPIEMEKTETSAVKKSIHLPPDSNKPDGIMQVTYWF
ncbi:hypothetical protein NQ317_010351 [Molorchus minor]|uniref:Uncharacterized protein n=1 Tax=Molorchus minor TaxID=1323400 RepID=A0ABQ9JVI9_9CUCU|nr:hypothetical protein NQ317_010351 [Molorchus minor]